MAGQGRTEPDRRKDCYYIYEVSVVFRNATKELSAILESVRAKIHRNWFRRFARDFEQLFLTPSSLGPIAATEIAREVERGGTAINEIMVHRATTRFMEGLNLRAY
jgi:hypothetical protein